MPDSGVSNLAYRLLTGLIDLVKMKMKHSNRIVIPSKTDSGIQSFG